MEANSGPKLNQVFQFMAPKSETQLAGVSLNEGQTSEPAAFGLVIHQNTVSKGIDHQGTKRT